MLAFYLDEDAIDRRVIRASRRRGIDVVSASEAGMLHRLDEEHLACSTQQSRVLYSFNVRDFCRIHGEWLRLGRLHAGILVAQRRHRYSVGTQLRGLLYLSAQYSPADMQNRLEYLSDWI